MEKKDGSTIRRICRSLWGNQHHSAVMKWRQLPTGAVDHREKCGKYTMKWIGDVSLGCQYYITIWMIRRQTCLMAQINNDDEDKWWQVQNWRYKYLVKQIERWIMCMHTRCRYLLSSLLHVSTSTTLVSLYYLKAQWIEKKVFVFGRSGAMELCKRNRWRWSEKNAWILTDSWENRPPSNT